MKRNIFRLILSAALMMCCTVMTWALETPPNDEIWYTSSDNSVITPFYQGGFGATILTNTYSGDKGVIKFNGPVTGIGIYAFFDCKNLKSITMPNSVTSIGESAFSSCSSLKEIKILKSVTSIGQYAFAGCSGLTSIVVDEGNEIYDSRNGCNAIIETATNTLIIGCQNTTIPNSLEKIGDGAFRDCTNLQSINIPTSVTSIGQSAFEKCTSLSRIEIPNTMTSIGEYAFNACAGLTSVSVTSGSIGSNAFADCANLSTVTLYDETTGNGVTSIGDDAFRECNNLRSIKIPGTVKSMGGHVFSKTYLNDVTIEDGAYIGEFAFPGYSGTLTIKGSLSGVGKYAFEKCTVLTSVSVTSGGIGKDAFNGCTNLNTVTFGEGVTYIGEYAFAACAGLTSISVLSGSIGYYAFAGCANLSTVTLGEGVTSIGDYAFRQCGNLKKITIPGTVKSMGDDVFSETYLNDVTIEDGAYIGVSAFPRYSGKLTIKGSLSGVGKYAFQECTLLTSVSVTSGGGIGDGAFAGCTGLTSISVTGGSIGDRAFQGCTGLTSISGTCGNIGKYAFQDCTGITSISVTSGIIGNYAFVGCTNLSTITLQKDVIGIDDWAFQGCSKLKDITVGWTEAEEIPSITAYVFNKIDISKITLHIPTYTIALYNAKDIWKDFYVYEDVNFIITKTDDTTDEQKLLDNGSVTIDESEDDIKSLVVSENAANVSVTYIRNFAKANKWQGWYVPFDVPMEDMAKAGFEVAEIYGILLDNSGNTVIAFLKMEEGTVKANTPYVVRPNTSGKVTLTTTTKLHQTKATQFAFSSAKDVYTIGGIYEQTVGDNWYAINKDGQFQLMGTDVSLRPFRIWMTIDPRDDNPYAPSVEAKARMNIMVLGDEETTGITSYDNDNENDNIYGSTGSPTMYNLNGQRMTSIKSGQIYIINNKKYIAR